MKYYRVISYCCCSRTRLTLIVLLAVGYIAGISFRSNVHLFSWLLNVPPGKADVHNGGPPKTVVGGQFEESLKPKLTMKPKTRYNSSLFKPIKFIPKRVLTQLPKTNSSDSNTFLFPHSSDVFLLQNRTLSCPSLPHPRAATKNAGVDVNKSVEASSVKRMKTTPGFRAIQVAEKRAALKAFMAAMETINLPVFLVKGTLLGWYRECDIIGHTSDIDFALDIRRVTRSVFDQFRQFSRSNFQAKIYDFYLRAMFGEPKDSWELSFRGRGDIKIDLFFAYPQLPPNNDTTSNSFYLPGYAQPDMIRWEYVVKEPGLCQATLIDVPVFVPCDPLSIIVADYGPNWATPVSDKTFKYWKTNNTKFVQKHRLKDFYDTF